MDNSGDSQFMLNFPSICQLGYCHNGPPKASLEPRNHEQPSQRVEPCKPLEMLINSSHCHYLGVSKNRGTPKSSILIGFSIINHPFWGPTPIFGSTPICHCIWFALDLLWVSLTKVPPQTVEKAPVAIYLRKLESLTLPLVAIINHRPEGFFPLSWSGQITCHWNFPCEPLE